MILFSLPRATTEQIRRIVHGVAITTGVSDRSMMSRIRTARVAGARQLAMTLIREQTNLSLMEIGRLFNRGHDTVIHAIKATNARIINDEETRELHEELSQRFQPAAALERAGDHLATNQTA